MIESKHKLKQPVNIKGKSPTKLIVCVDDKEIIFNIGTAFINQSNSLVAVVKDGSGIQFNGFENYKNTFPNNIKDVINGNKENN